MNYVIYTDGACAPTNPGPSGYGFVIKPGVDGSPMTQRCGFLGHGTNQTAEITAAIKGLQALPATKLNKISLYSDSMYVINGISKWRAAWERKGWRNAEGKPVANLELWKQLFKEVDARSVTPIWVKGHNGDIMNELADELAQSALKTRQFDPCPVTHTAPNPAAKDGGCVEDGGDRSPSLNLHQEMFVSMIREMPGRSCATTPSGVFRDPVVQQRWEGWVMALTAMRPRARAENHATQIRPQSGLVRGQR